MRTLLHRCVNLDLKAEGIGKLQGAALERLLRKRVRDTVFRKERRGLVEVLLVCDLEAQAVAAGGASLAHHQRGMLILLRAPPVHRLLAAVPDISSATVVLTT